MALETIKKLIDLPLTKFVECCCGESKEALLTLPLPEGYQFTQEDIIDVERAWALMLMQYYEVVGDENARRYIELTSELGGLNLLISLKDVMVGYLTNIGYNEDICNHLKPFLKRVVNFTPETLSECIKQVESDFIRHKLRIAKIDAELETLNKTNEAKLPKEADMYEYVTKYNEHMKTTYSIGNMSTMEYALICKGLREHIEKQLNR